MSDIKADKHALADQLATFVEHHGIEEAGKLLSRFLLGLAHQVEAEKIEFTDHIGRVLIEPVVISDEQKH